MNKRLKFSGHTMGAPGRDIYEVIKLFKEIGYDGIEVRVAANGQINSETITDDEAKSILRAAKNESMEFSCLTSYYQNFVDPNVRESVIKNLKRVIEIADLLECPLIRVYGGVEPYTQKDVDCGKYYSAIIIESPLKYIYITKSLSLNDNTKNILDSTMQAKYRYDALVSAGLSPSNAAAINNARIESELVETGKSQRQNFFYTYVLIMMLYMAILLYGQFVATTVATEKSSRTMELLITSAKPLNLMFGKVIGSGLAGLTQMVLILGAGFAFFNINKEFWSGNMIIQSIFDMPLEIMLFTILFFILGYFLYSFMYGAFGSLANKTEDINTSILPVTFVFLAAFFISMTSMTGGAVDSPLMIAASYIPFTSPMVMFVRICMSEVKAIEIIISVAVLVLSTIVIGYISAGIYRIGVLLYGKPPKLKELLRMIKLPGQQQ
jgi:ABC-2 type transport system permease protein